MSTSLEANKALCRRCVEILNAGDLDGLAPFVAPGFVTHDNFAGQGSDFRSFQRGYALFRAVFPDFQLAIEDMVAEGDRVALRFVGRGTHLGEAMGVAPSGKEVAVRGLDVFRIEDGKLAEHWGVGDMLGLLQQIGVLPRLEF
jgi:steroid delta-isomerase-like uncharacterized protein